MISITSLALRILNELHNYTQSAWQSANVFPVPAYRIVRLAHCQPHCRAILWAKAVATVSDQFFFSWFLFWQLRRANRQNVNCRTNIIENHGATLTAYGNSLRMLFGAPIFLSVQSGSRFFVNTHTHTHTENHTHMHICCTNDSVGDQWVGGQTDRSY